MDIKELENRVEEHIGHDYDCALFDETNNQCDCGTFKTVRQIMSSFNSYMAEVIGIPNDAMPSPQTYYSNTPQDSVYLIGKNDGRNELIKEQYIRAGLSQPATKQE